MLLGKYVLPISTDGRLALPLDYRPDLSKGVVYLTRGFDGNVLLLTKIAFEKLYSHVKSTSITDPLARLLTRLILGNAVETGVDSDGVLQVPATLLDFVDHGEEIVLVGQGEYLELWTSSIWKKQSDILQDYSQNVQRFEKFNVSLA
jgi:division/cell wall cluster transcriptional repressor MraZ